MLSRPKEGAMIHIIYRSYGGENMKRRPPYYSKYLSLLSLVRAYQEIVDDDAELIYLNDGPIPPDRLRIMKNTGEVISKADLGNAGSIRLALKLPFQREWPADDLVWFAEDDYLYLPRSLNNLVVAGTKFPNADYFGLYALIGNRQPNGLPHIDCRVPPTWHSTGETDVSGHSWRSALSTTSTFGARVRALRSDHRMMAVAMQTGGAWDHTTCLAYQGFQPFPLRFLVESVQQATGLTGLTRAGLLAGLRWVYSFYFRAWQWRSRSRMLVAADPALISHLESGNLALGTDWGIVAQDINHWASQSGYSR